MCVNIIGTAKGAGVDPAWQGGENGFKTGDPLAVTY
jgi:hypothetical protein